MEVFRLVKETTMKKQEQKEKNLSEGQQMKYLFWGVWGGGSILCLFFIFFVKPLFIRFLEFISGY